MKNTWVELDLDVLLDNVRRMQQVLQGRTEIIFVVKSDAYGHGMMPVVECVSGCGVRWFAVAYVDEAVRIRERLADATIIVLGAARPDDVPAMLKHRLIPVVTSGDHGRQLSEAALKCHAVLPCHVKIDTGMGRLGILWETAAVSIGQLAAEKGLLLTGVCSHFASSGQTGGDFTQIQAGRFSGAVTECSKKGIAFPFKHISNSGGFLMRGDLDFDGVRPGLLLYGYGSADAGKNRICTRPFLHWKTRVVHVKGMAAGCPIGYDCAYVTRTATRIAVLDVGYADGYFRRIGGSGFVLIGGRRAPVVGRISMNLITVDLGPEADAQAGDEAVLLGQQGKESIWADEIAGWCDTIAYEVLTAIRTDDRRIRGARG